MTELAIFITALAVGTDIATNSSLSLAFAFALGP